MMKSNAGRVIIACCALAAIAVVAALLIVGFRVRGFGQEVKTPTLFVQGYQAGEELAGFSGRPMVLVFGEKTNPAWNEFLLACEADPQIAKFLQDSFVGVFVDVHSEINTVEIYDVQEVGQIIIKDVHGPILGNITKYTINEIKKILSDINDYLIVEPSPLYSELLLRGPEVIKDMIKDQRVEDVLKTLDDLRYFEGINSDLVKSCDALAVQMGIK